MSQPAGRPASGPPRSTAASLALLILIWGTTWAVISIGLTAVPPFTGLAIRFALAGLVLLALTPLFKVRLGRSRRERWLWLANAVLTFAGPYGATYWAEQHIPSGLAAVIFATFPLFVGVLAHFFLPGDRLSRGGVAGVLVGFAGIAILYSEDMSRLGGPGVTLGAAVMLAAPALAAVGQTLIKRYGEEVHPLSLTAVPILLASLLLAPLAWAVERQLPMQVNAASVGSILYLALFGSALAFTLYFGLLSRMRSSRLALITYLTPLVAVLIGVLLLDEPLTLRIALGTAGVLGGVGLAVRA